MTNDDRTGLGLEFKILTADLLDDNDDDDDVII